MLEGAVGEGSNQGLLKLFNCEARQVKAMAYVLSSERKSISTLSLVGQTAGLPPPSTSSPSNSRARCLPFLFLADPLVPPAPFGCGVPVIEVLEGIRGERSGAITLKTLEAR